MSDLGSISAHLGREQQLLRQLNSALIALEADALGRTSEFGLSEEDIAENRRLILDFVVRFHSALDDESTSLDMRSLIHRLKSGIKPIGDWREDLDDLINQLEQGGELGDNAIPTLEDIISLIDIEFTEDLKRLYAR